MRKALTISVLALVTAGVVAGCSSDRRVVRHTETVETVPAAPVVEQTTIRRVPAAPPPVVEQRTYESQTVETYDD